MTSVLTRLLLFRAVADSLWVDSGEKGLVSDEAGVPSHVLSIPFLTHSFLVSVSNPCPHYALLRPMLKPPLASVYPFPSCLSYCLGSRQPSSAC